MQTEQPEGNFIASFFRRNRFIFKGFLIAFILLLLLIPTAYIQSLISERKSRQQEAIDDISSKWAGTQEISGPAIGVPFFRDRKDDKGNIERVREIAYFLPESLDIKGSMLPEERSRGIYKVIVYTSELTGTGKFGKLDIASLGINPASLLLNEAFVLFSIDDIRGIKEEFRMTLADSTYELIPGSLPENSFGNVLIARININDIMQPGAFSWSLKLRGSKSLAFQPLGKRTHVSVASKWADPSFNGNYLPDTRTVTNKGFQADWNVLFMNRNYPQQWVGKGPEINESSFGVDLLVPVDSYLKSERSVKYAILVIVLTFTAFFLIELIYSKTVHAFQYILVGFALCLFYTLLISISEYLHFNLAYLIAAIATVGLVVLYVRSVFSSVRLSSFIGLTLSAIYGFIFLLIQSQDYALLMGSIGLFLTLALVMYFSRKARF